MCCGLVLCSALLAGVASGRAEARDYDVAALSAIGATADIAFSPDGRTMAMACDSKSVFFWDTSEWTLKRKLGGHADQVRAVTFSPNGAQLASAGLDGRVMIWSTDTGEPSLTIECGAPACSVSFSSDGGSVVVGCEANDIGIWDCRTGLQRQKLTGHKTAARAATFSPDGMLVAAGSDDGTVRLWDAASGKLRATLEGHGAAVVAVGFAPDGKALASGSKDGTIRLWDPASGTCRATLYAHGGGVADLAFSPDGTAIASVGQDGVVRVWSARTCELVRVLREMNGCVSFSPDGKLLATGTDHCENFIWDWASMSALAKDGKGRRDLRPEFDRLGIAAPRNQSPRGTCSVFAITDAIGYAIAKRRGTGEFQSAEYLNWASQTINNYGPDADGSYFDGCIRGFEAHGICAERLMPYESKRSQSPPTEEARADAEANRKLRLRFHAIDKPGLEVNSPNRENAKLARRARDGYISDIKKTINRGYPVAAGCYHSVLIVGYVDDPAYEGGGVFIVRDSASVSYRELSYSFVRYRMTEFCWYE